MADTAAVVAFPNVNPLDWLGGQALAAAGDGWRNLMVGLWSAGLWLLELAFRVIDAFMTPDVSPGGPLAGALPTTMWLGLFVAGLVMLLQLGTALAQRDGEGLGRILLGLAQFGAVWICYLAVAGVLIVAAGALTQAILASMLDVGSWSEYAVGESWPRSINDAVAATVLGLAAFVLLIPAAFGYLMVMLVREGALVILLATAPISAAGLLGDSTKMWFWKTTRWFIASLLLAPFAALILGVGVQLSNGVVQGAGTDTVAAVGTAVVGCVLVLLGAICPMKLFSLLAFVEPGTGSGSALRQSMSDAGGISGLMSGGGKGAGGGQGTSAATQSDGGGRSQGEAAAETQTSSRMASMLGPVGAGVGMALNVAGKAADLATDVLASAGIGDPGYRSDPRQQHSGQSGGTDRGEPGGHDSGPAQTDDPAGGSLPPRPPMTPPAGGPPGAGGMTPGGGAGGVGGAAGEAGAAGGAGAEAAVLVL